MVFSVAKSIAFFVDKRPIKIIILSQLVTEASVTLFRYLLFSQMHEIGFQL